MSVLVRLAARTPGAVGSPWSLVLAAVLLVVWLVLGPVFGWSGGWVLWPATITSVGAFVLVLLLQYSQNRDMRAIHLKLDEVIRALGDARTRLVRLEQLSDEELDQLEEEFRRLRDDEAA